MKFALWMFGVICGIVFMMGYNYVSEEDKVGIVIVAFVVSLVVALVDGVQSLPDRNDDKEVK